jgi:hypothetical protein
MQETLGGAGLSMGDLERIRIPGGGATTWEVPTLEGPESVKELRGIILAHSGPRVYWESALDDKEPGPPECSSDDGKIGIGRFGVGSDQNPSGRCESCPMNAWGSAGGGKKGKACREQRNIVMMLPGQIFPVLLTLPVSSIQPSRKYMLLLAQHGLAPYAVETTVTLEAQNRGGQRWSTAQFQVGRKLDSEEVAKAREMADIIKGAVLTVGSDTIDV